MNLKKIIKRKFKKKTKVFFIFLFFFKKKIILQKIWKKLKNGENREKNAKKRDFLTKNVKNSKKTQFLFASLEGRVGLGEYILISISIYYY